MNLWKITLNKRTGQFAIAIPVQVHASGQCCSKIGQRLGCSQIGAQQFLHRFRRKVLALCPVEDENRAIH